jgi:hypothetical protein
MYIVKSQNNWKLLTDDKNIYWLELPSGEKKELRYSEHTCINTFNHAVKYNWTWVKREYFIPSVVRSKIIIRKYDKDVKSDKLDLFNNNHYTSENQAKIAINDLMSLALEKFELCKKELKELENRLLFYKGYNYDGDSFGIYNEYEYISFTIQNINFQFEL